MHGLFCLIFILFFLCWQITLFLLKYLYVTSAGLNWLKFLLTRHTCSTLISQFHIQGVHYTGFSLILFYNLIRSLVAKQNNTNANREWEYQKNKSWQTKRWQWHNLNVRPLLRFFIYMKYVKYSIRLFTNDIT